MNSPESSWRRRPPCPPVRYLRQSPWHYRDVLPRRLSSAASWQARCQPCLSTKHVVQRHSITQTETSGQRISTTGRLAWGRILGGRGECNVTPTSLEHCSRPTTVPLLPLLSFLLRKLTQHRLSMLFTEPDNPKIASSHGVISIYYTVPCLHSNRHLDRFSDQSTDTDRPRYSACSNRPHHALRAGDTVEKQ